MRRYLVGALATALLIGLGAGASEVWTWSTTAASNNEAPPDGFPENQARSTINDGIRELMAALKRWYDDPEWTNAVAAFTVTKLDDDTFRVAGTDATSIFTTDRAVLLSNGSTDAVGFVATAVYNAPNTDVDVTFHFGEVVPAGTNVAKPHAMANLGRAAFLNNGPGATQVPRNGDLGALAALDAPDRTVVALVLQSDFVEGAEKALFGMEGLAFPDATGGVKHSVHVACAYTVCNRASAGTGVGDKNIEIKIRMGTAGTIADAQQFIGYATCRGNAAPSYGSFAMPELDLVPGSSDLLTVSAKFPTEANGELNRQIGQCRLVVTEVYE